MITFPLWLKFYIGLFCFLIFTGTLRRILTGKMLVSVEKLPIEKKRKFIKSYETVVRMHKILLVTIPVGFLAVFYGFYKYQTGNIFHMSLVMILSYVIVIEDLFFRQFILKKVKKT
jgi:hypothetical protein